MTSKNNILQNVFVRVGLKVLVILAILYIVTLLSPGAEWTLSDFMFAAAFFMVVGLAFELLVHRVKDTKKRLIAGVVLALAFVYLWAEAAVGIFTNIGS